MRRPIALAVLFLAACSGGTSATDASTQSDAAVPGSDGATPRGDGGGGGVSDGGMGVCDPPGRFGTPENTFVLPATGGGQTIYYDDVQASFPDVDWQTLDRLYLPAGHYRSLRIGNLPARTADRPLVITNQGGQVFVGENPGGNYIWSMGGGSGWILTGRYDSVSQTGDAAFPGHACGAYAGSAGAYGIVSDDGFALDAPYLHMGISVAEATDFENRVRRGEALGFRGDSSAQLAKRG